MTIQPNIGEHGTLFVTGRDQGANAVPSIILASEHYNLIARMLQQKIPVKLAVEIQATFNEDDRNTQNVIAEIPGTDNAIKDEIVMVGAHLDSWHTGTGATDNADGSATVMEAMRILKALNIRPRRTIRAALWAGEEQGLLGSKAYVEQHLAGDKNKAARDKFSVYFNLDNGYPPISGFYMEGNDPARAIMAEWLKPMANLGAIMPAPGHIGATDHLSFLDVGVPGFQAVQEYINYDVRTHHTNADTAERIDPNALKQAATVMAAVLYQASMREGTFPKPAPPKPKPRPASNHEGHEGNNHEDHEPIFSDEKQLSWPSWFCLRVLRGRLWHVTYCPGLAADPRAQSKRDLHGARNRCFVPAHRAALALEARRRRRFRRSGRRRRSPDPFSSRQQS